jgi:hypothetical protein
LNCSILMARTARLLWEYLSELRESRAAPHNQDTV